MPGLQPGVTISCSGEWKNHPVHGRQFGKFSYFQIEAPADELGIKKYLGYGLIKGIGPKYAERIVNRFGIDTLTIIENNPEKLFEIAGLGAKRIEKIKICWQGQKSIREVMIFLQSYGVSPAFAQKIYKTYGNQSISKLKENPYRLSRDIFGIGFKTADQLAQKMGIAHHSVLRLDAGIEYVLSQLSQDGHVCYPTDDFVQEAVKILEALPDTIQERLSILFQDNRIELQEIIVEGKKRSMVWLKQLYLAEIGIARELRRLKNSKSLLCSINCEQALKWVQEELQIQLAPNQQQAVKCAITNKLHIITGGPGTGKKYDHKCYSFHHKQTHPKNLPCCTNW